MLYNIYISYPHMFPSWNIHISSPSSRIHGALSAWRSTKGLKACGCASSAGTRKKKMPKRMIVWRSVMISHNFHIHGMYIYIWCTYIYTYICIYVYMWYIYHEVPILRRLLATMHQGSVVATASEAPSSSPGTPTLDAMGSGAPIITPICLWFMIL